MLNNNKLLFIITQIDYVNRVGDATRQDIMNRVVSFSEQGVQVILIELSRNISCREDDVYGSVKVIRLPIKNEGMFRHYRRRGIDSRMVVKDIDSLVYLHKPTHIWFEYDFFAHLLRALKSRYSEINMAIRSHNYELGHSLEIWNYSGGLCKNGLKAWLSYIIGQVDIFFTYKIIAKYADIHFCVSKLDKEKFKKFFKSNNIKYLPLFQEYPKHICRSDESFVNVFYLSSTLSNTVNKSGLDMLYCIAAVCMDIPVVFHVTGKYTDMDIVPMKNVVHHGFINDLENFFVDMDVAIAPVFIGYGMKGKVYEILKRGFPAVLSPRSHDVFCGENGLTYEVATSLDEWKQSVESLLDGEARTRYGNAAHSFMLENFQKKYIVDQLDSFISVGNK